MDTSYGIILVQVSCMKGRLHVFWIMVVAFLSHIYTLFTSILSGWTIVSKLSTLTRTGSRLEGQLTPTCCLWLLILLIKRAYCRNRAVCGDKRQQGNYKQFSFCCYFIFVNNNVVHFLHMHSLLITSHVTPSIVVVGNCHY